MASIKRSAEMAVLRAVIAGGRYAPIRRLLDRVTYLLDKGAVERLIDISDCGYDLSWRELDRIYSHCRRQLMQQSDWRFGPDRVYEVASEGYFAIRPYTTLDGKVYCDLGCGSYHPYGVAAAMFLNGAASTISLDLVEASRPRAAEALADLLHDCCMAADRWNWCAVEGNEFVRRIQQFDSRALLAGRLDEGLLGLPLRYILTDIHHPILEEATIDVMTSRAVLEHFLDFEVSVRRLFALMKSGGVASHHIDIVDHRAYTNSKYHYWSFLAEDEGWSDGLVNRLRPSELRQHFEEAGFEILSWKIIPGEVPTGLRDQVIGRFRKMSDEDLSATGVACVVRKP